MSIVDLFSFRCDDCSRVSTREKVKNKTATSSKHELKSIPQVLRFDFGIVSNVHHIPEKFTVKPNLGNDELCTYELRSVIYRPGAHYLVESSRDNKIWKLNDNKVTNLKKFDTTNVSNVFYERTKG